MLGIGLWTYNLHCLTSKGEGAKIDAPILLEN